jgi:hypothetical protein
MGGLSAMTQARPANPTTKKQMKTINPKTQRQFFLGFVLFYREKSDY